MGIRRFFAVLAGMVALGWVIQASAQTLPTTTWLGNSFGGGPRGKWVQNFIFTMAVNGEGRCFTASHWDEAHRESGIYQDGDVIGNCKGAVGEAVDDKGDIWTDGQLEMRHFPLQGFDPHGNPIYSYESMRALPFPPPFTKVSRIEYHPDTDVMYLSGYTAEQPYSGKFWKEAGRVLARYDNWSKGEPKPKWQIQWHWNEGDRSVYATPHSFATAGDSVYRAANGQFVGEIKPGPEVGGVLGDIDVVSGIRAMKWPDGEYIILQEDDRYGKIVMFRWKPEGEQP